MSLPAATVTATANPWLRILGALEKKITRHSYDTWLKPTRFSHINGNIIFVRVPNPEFRQLGEKFGDLIQEAMDTLAPEYQDVKFVTAEEDPTVPPVRADGGFAPVSASGTSHPRHQDSSALTGILQRSSAPSTPLEHLLSALATSLRMQPHRP